LAVFATLATMLATVGAIAPVPVGASPLASPAAHATDHSTAQKIPTGLARAIHARLGPGPIGLGTAPLVSGMVPASGGWSAKDPSQAVTAQISRAGRTSVSLGGSAPVSLEAVSLHAGSTTTALSLTSSALTRGRLTQGLGAVQSLQQVTAAGLEQQFVIPHAPIRAAGTVTLGLSSSSPWRVVRGGSAVQVVGSHLLYGGLRATDASGRVLASHFVVAGSGPKIVVDARAATYPITIDPTWTNSATPTATLISSAGQLGTNFGYSVALSADDTVALVGASESGVVGPKDGAVYVYRVASVKDWSTTATPSATLADDDIDGPLTNFNFGYSVALSGDGTTALIGATGETPYGSAAFIFQVASETAWVGSPKPKATLFDGTGSSDRFGYSVALSSNGTVALVGAPLTSSSPDIYTGAAYLYRAASETAWASTATPTATLDSGATATQQFGYSVAVSATGTTALVGSLYGGAYVFHVASVTKWVSTAKPTATLSNGTVGGQFGNAVALSGDGTTALIGAPSAVVSNAEGAAYVFQSSAGNVWPSSPTPVATLTNGVFAADDFASSVALSAKGTTALIGAYGVSTDTGAAYVFDVSSESGWASDATPSPTATLTNGSGAPNDRFGSSLGLSPDGTTVLIDNGSTSFAGTDYLYHSPSAGAWSSSSAPTATITDGGNPSAGVMGYSVALSADGTTALVGYTTAYTAVAGGAVNDDYIFHASSEGSWSSSATSVATLSNDVAGDTEYGTSVALSADGTTAFVGDLGQTNPSGPEVYVYHVSSEGAWSSKAPLVATLTDAGASAGSFGWAIALSADGTTALIGNGLFADETDICSLTGVGNAYIFHVSSESAWTSSSTPTATLSNSNASGTCFGSAVALSADGTTALVGAFGTGGVGAAYIFHASSEHAWSSTSSPKATLTDATAGWFGWSLALSADGTTALIGAPDSYDGIATNTGSAYVYKVGSESAWSTTSTPEATLTDAGPNYYTVFGWSVALSAAGTTALIGGNGAGTAGYPGAVFVFNAPSESAWATSSTPASTLFDSEDPAGSFGWAIALSKDGTTALIGAYGAYGNAFIYRNTSKSVTTPDGAGTMTVSPTSVVAGSTTNTLTFTYKASGGALNDGTIDVTVPIGWTPPSLPIINARGPYAGYTTSTCGYVSIGDGGDGIDVTGVTLADNATCTITYGDPSGGSGTTVTAPSSATTSTFTTSTASMSTGTLADIATQPKVNVKATAQVITMAPTAYTTVSRSGTYNVGATSNDTDPGAVITYSVAPTATDSAGCSVGASGNVSFTRAGTCTIDAGAQATANFGTATQVQQVVNVYVVIPTITITFDSDGGSAVGPRKGPIGSTITLPAAPKYTGYTFSGWSFDPPGQGGSIATSPYTLTASLTLYAVWVQDLENITFNSEGGSTVFGIDGYYGTTITLPAAPTYAGHTFEGWFLKPSGGTALTSPYTLTASLTLYAQWKVT